MPEIDSPAKWMMEMVKWGYDDKLLHAESMAWAFFKKMRGLVYVGVGGLDSITLLLFLRDRIDKGIPGVTISVIEDKGVQEVHRSLENMVYLKPLKSKVGVLKEFGYPIISKEKARKISFLQRKDSDRLDFIRAIMTGKEGAQGGYGFSERIKLPDKWIKLFGGNYAELRPDLVCKLAPFKVSSECCKWMKEKPSQIFQKETGLSPFMGLMMAEGGQRKWGLMKNGCNYYGKTINRSCPFAIFNKSDLLRLALELKVPIPKEYGKIIELPEGGYETTEAKRTGCSMCGFGIHMEKRPHRFDRMLKNNPAEWEFWIKRMGWGEVLTYIGVKWE